MPPTTSSWPNDTLTLFDDGDAHVPSVVARIVSVTGSPALFDLAMKSHVAASSGKLQPFGTAVPRVSLTGTHLACTCTSVAGFEKSSSNMVSPVPCVYCTSMVSMFGGRSTPSGG